MVLLPTLPWIPRGYSDDAQLLHSDCSNLLDNLFRGDCKDPPSSGRSVIAFSCLLVGGQHNPGLRKHSDNLHATTMKNPPSDLPQGIPAVPASRRQHASESNSPRQPNFPGTINFNRFLDLKPLLCRKWLRPDVLPLMDMITSNSQRLLQPLFQASTGHMWPYSNSELRMEAPQELAILWKRESQ